MNRVRRLAIVAGVAATLCAVAPSAQAVIIGRSSIRNTSAPTGTNYNSGWQYQGNWAGGFTGTPIHKNYFLTAGHVGGGVGGAIYYAGQNYTTTAVYDDPNTDLRLYKISGSFPTWAPIYTGTSETAKRGMIFGRGTGRGSEVKVGTALKGWKWGTGDGRRSWGENNVAGTVEGGAGMGQLLRFTFNKPGSSGSLYNEGALSTGDSGGGVFINDAGKWKLAGINYLVEGPFSLTGTTGSGFNASPFDKGGLYQGGDGKWKFNADSSADLNGQWYATRVSSRQAWIKSITGTITTSSAPMTSLTGTVAVPEPASAGLLAIGASMLLRRRRRA